MLKCSDKRKRAKIAPQSGSVAKASAVRVAEVRFWQIACSKRAALLAKTAVNKIANHGIGWEWTKFEFRKDGEKNVAPKATVSIWTKVK